MLEHGSNPTLSLLQLPHLGVATLLRVTLFRGDFSPADKIPSCQDSEDTLVRGRHRSKVPLVRGDMSPEGTSFRGDICVEKIPRSLNFAPAGYVLAIIYFDARWQAE